MTETNLIEIQPAKEIKGSLALPPSPDLLFLSLTLAAAIERAVRITPLVDTPLGKRWIETFSPLLDIREDGDAHLVTPRAEQAGGITVPSSEVPFRELSVFILLGRGKTILFEEITAGRIEAWRKAAKRFGCTLESKALDGGTALFLASSSSFTIPDVIIEPWEVPGLLGLALGMQQAILFRIEHQLSTPLRHVLNLFNRGLSVKSAVTDKETNPLARQLRFMQSRKKTDTVKPCFVVSADFTATGEGVVDLSLPGDDLLGAIMLMAKSIQPRGTLVLSNVPLEPWNCATLNLIRKMGCKPAVQETLQTSYGASGMVQLQRYTPVGRKTECQPLLNYTSQLPAMVALACYAEGQSIFRELEELRQDATDTLVQLCYCIELLGCRHGEMPDGIVIDGARQFDGFDLNVETPAAIAGAWAVAGLKCIGRTTIAAEALLQRWPRFKEQLDNVCEYRV